MSDYTITAIVDKYLQRWVDKGLNMLPGDTEPAMTDGGGANNEGWMKWFPIDSTVTDEAITAVEKQLGYKLPNRYIAFLKHKFFYELYIFEARFSEHVINQWQQQLPDMAFDGYPREFLIDKGYIPFADWYDWGMLCFDTNGKNADFDYPIIMWDHERWDEYEPFSNNFHELLLKLDREDTANSG